ncbi:MAG: Dehydrogenase, partial [uncultured Friedmanniella sp.]
ERRRSHRIFRRSAVRGVGGRAGDRTDAGRRRRRRRDQRPVLRLLPAAAQPATDRRRRPRHRAGGRRRAGAGRPGAVGARAAGRRRRRRRAEPDHPGRSRRRGDGRPAGGQAPLRREAARAGPGRRRRPAGSGRGRWTARRLGPGHGARHGTADRSPAAGRRGRRRAARRRRLLELARPREMAPGAVLLLPAGRWPAAGHGAVLPDRPGHAARAGAAGDGHQPSLRASADGGDGPAGGRSHPGGDRHVDERGAGAPQRGHLDAVDVLRPLGHPAAAVRGLRHRGDPGRARPQPLRRPRGAVDTEDATLGDRRACRWLRRRGPGLRVGGPGARGGHRQAAPRVRGTGPARAGGDGRRDPVQRRARRHRAHHLGGPARARPGGQYPEQLV